MTDHQQRAVLLGATGLVGTRLLPLLLEQPRYGAITVVARRAVSVTHPRLRQAIANPLRSDAEAIADALACDDVFCCLGTTMKSAGSREAFAQVDRDLVVAFARVTRERGARRFFVVSAVGADARSHIFYNRIKGEMEAELGRLGFDELHVFRPSLLLGERGERRLGESLAQAALGPLASILAGPLTRWRPVSGDAVARAMAKAATTSAPASSGLIIHDNASMVR